MYSMYVHMTRTGHKFDLDYKLYSCGCIYISMWGCGKAGFSLTLLLLECPYLLILFGRNNNNNTKAKIFIYVDYTYSVVSTCSMPLLLVLCVHTPCIPFSQWFAYLFFNYDSGHHAAYYCTYTSRFPFTTCLELELVSGSKWYLRLVEAEQKMLKVLLVLQERCRIPWLVGSNISIYV